MEAYLAPNAPRFLQRAAQYEMAVASLRGKGEMTSQLDRIRDYFQDIEIEVGTGDLQNATTLVVYAVAAHRMGHLQAEGREVFGWRQKVEECLSREVERAPGPGRKGELMQMQGRLSLVPKCSNAKPNIDQAIDIWLKMIEQVDSAPLFPIRARFWQVGD
jgi:hypothetical protein